jgi:hypothetical protein
LRHINFFCGAIWRNAPSFRFYTHGILGVYELARIELLRDVFIWAYGRSCARYSAVRQSLGEPDPFRLRYRQELMALHEGNVARYRLRPSEYQSWRMNWR